MGNPPTKVTVVDGRRCVLAVVGEAPGGNEERTGKLFSGAAGELLWEELAKLGLQRRQFHVTNVAKCRPSDNRTPTPGEIKTCVGLYLNDELGVVKPRYGLLLGNSALRGVLGKSGITKYNAQVFTQGRTTWVAAFHPAAVLRNPRLINEFKAALLRFASLIRNEEGQPVTESIAVNDKETLNLLIEELKKAKRGAIDIESWSSHPGHGSSFKGGGLAWWHHDWRLTHINFAFQPGTAYVLPLWNKYSRWRNPERVLSILKPYIEAVPYWICHNGKYDVKCLEKSGINIRHRFDTMGATYALDENNRKDLGFLATIHLQAPNYKEDIDKGRMNVVTLEQAVPYGGRDADYTLRLGSKLKRALKQDGLSDRLYRKLLHTADLALADVESRGLPLHQGKLHSRQTINNERLAEAQTRVEDLAGIPVNPRSPAQLGKALFGHLGFPVVERTKSGAASTAEKALARLKDLDEIGIINAIEEFRQWDGYRSRYFDNWFALMDSAGRLHPSFKPYHTVTGRLSASAPNVQQIPRDTFIRGIVGGRKGWTFIEADFSQIELRLAAHYSQDRTLLRIFNTGRDPHTETAMAVTGLSLPEITPEIRKKAKAVNFGYLYGMGWRKFLEYCKTKFGLDVSPSEAQHSRHVFFQTFRQLPGWHQRQREVAGRRKWVVSSIGRKRHLWDIDSTNKEVKAEAERQAINSPVQSLASDMMLMAMSILHEKLNYQVARIVSTVHDAILFEVRDDAVDDVVPIIREVMTNLPLESWFDCLLSVPIEVEIKAGKYWSEGSKALAI